MDSGNSGSLQSSSGGDDEFDSRGGGGGGGGGGADSSPLSALLRPSPSPSAAAFSLHGSYFGGLQEFTSAPPPPQQQQQQQPGAWPSGSFAGASGLPSSSSPRVGHADAGGAGARTQGADAAVASAAAQTGQGGGMGAPAPAQQPPRGSRKRTRASRRAPTTVLTTDTSNFRAMVQEFTGIPSPPFGAGVGVGGLGGPAASLRTRFDHIFPPPSSSLRSGGGGGTGTDASLPPYLLRPFPHKLPSSAPSAFPPFTSSSSSTPSSSTVGTTNANAATGAGTTASASSSNPAAPTDAFQQLTSSALLRLQQDASSYLSFQNLLDSSHPSSQSIFGSAGGFPQPSSRLHDPTPSPSDFLATGGVGSGSLGLAHHHHGGLLGSEGLHLHHSRSDVHGHGDELSGVVAAGGSCKLNYSSSHAGAAATSSSSAAASGAEKPPDGAGPGRPGRGGDGLDPWICTSE